MKISHMLAAASAGLIGLGASAQAETLLISYVEPPGGIYFSFEQSSTPTPLTYYAGAETTVPVTDFISNFAVQAYFIWDGVAEGGGFKSLSYTYIVFGPQFYTGPESAPVFAPGGFIGHDVFTGFDGVLTATVVPEPASWALTLVGVGMIGAGLRASRKAPAAA